MDIITYIDSIGRTCFGELVEKTESEMEVKSPAMIMVTPNDSSNMKVDVMPLFFTEFSSGESPTFVYTTNQYTEVKVDISNKILEHYSTKINVTEEPNPEPSSIEKAKKETEGDVPEVTLFEE